MNRQFLISGENQPFEDCRGKFRHGKRGQTAGPATVREGVAALEHPTPRAQHIRHDVRSPAFGLCRLLHLTEPRYGILQLFDGHRAVRAHHDASVVVNQNDFKLAGVASLKLTLQFRNRQGCRPAVQERPVPIIWDAGDADAHATQSVTVDRQQLILPHSQGAEGVLENYY